MFYYLNSVLLMIACIISILFAFMIHVNEQLGDDVPFTLEAALFNVISVIPPMFYRYNMYFKAVMLVHIILFLIAIYYTFYVNAILSHLEKYEDTNLPVYSTICCVSYASTVIFGHFMKRKNKDEMKPMTIASGVRQDINAKNSLQI